jgi:type IV fimbrial biogenesis protein FimT
LLVNFPGKFVRRIFQGRNRGFSVVELMAIVMIVGILLAIGIPSFQSLIHRQRLTTTANALFMAANLTRSEAIHRGLRVDLVPAGNGTSWNDGWVVFIDRNGNQRPEQGETVIFMHDPVGNDLSITPRFTDSKVQYIAFNGTGRTRTNANSQTSQSGNWLLELGKQSRKVVINFLGRPRVCNPQDDAANC